MLEPTLTVNEAAQYLKLRPQTIRGWIRSGRLRAAKVGRQYVILQSELRERDARNTARFLREFGQK